MRSWRDLGIGIGLALAVAATGCAEPLPAPTPVELDCAQSALTYENFGEPFFLDWCRGCHSSALAEDDRQEAPIDVNLDSREAVELHAADIAELAGPGAPVMPPAGGPSDDERALLAEWLACGMP